MNGDNEQDRGQYVLLPITANQRAAVLRACRGDTGAYSAYTMRRAAAEEAIPDDLKKNKRPWSVRPSVERVWQMVRLPRHKVTKTQQQAKEMRCGKKKKKEMVSGNSSEV